MTMNELKGPQQLRQMGQGQGEELKAITTLRASAGGVPVGMYPQAVLVGVYHQPEDQVRGYGEGVKWVFEVASGQHKGQRASRITTGMVPTPKNALGKMVVSLTGKPLDMGGDTDLASLIGRTYGIVVAATESGGTRVESASIMAE